MNVYDKDHPLQKAWDSLDRRCLCGHFESCNNCDGSQEPAKRAIAQLARSQGYRIYIKPWYPETEPKPLDYEYYLDGKLK